MIRYRGGLSTFCGACLLVLSGCAPIKTTREAVPALDPGRARVWFIRQAEVADDPFYAAAPIVYANGAPIGKIGQAAAFFQDFSPGTYRFTVEPFGIPSKQHDTLHLAAGTRNYLQIQWQANWETGHIGGSSFTVLNTSPEVARQYLPTLTISSVARNAAPIATLPSLAPVTESRNF
jgi:hypothetical protein